MPRRSRLGAVQALAANVSGVVMNLCFKLIAVLPSAEIIVLRSACALVPLVLLHLGDRRRGDAKVSGFSPLVIVRAACEAAATLFLIIALAHTSLALVTAITLTIPLLVTLIGVVVFRERANAAIWAGVMFGLFGAIIVLQPTTNAAPIGMAAAGLAALSYAARDSVTVRISHHYGAVFMTLTANIATLVLGLVLSVRGGWQPLALAQAGYLTIAIVAYIASSILVAAAVKNAGLILSGIFRYITVPTALALDYVLFSIAPTPGALMGTAIIMLSSAVVLAASPGFLRTNIRVALRK